MNSRLTKRFLLSLRIKPRNLPVAGALTKVYRLRRNCDNGLLGRGSASMDSVEPPLAATWRSSEAIPDVLSHAALALRMECERLRLIPQLHVILINLN